MHLLLYERGDKLPSKEGAQGEDGEASAHKLERVVRRAIEETIKREESRLKERDRARMRAAALRTGQLRRRIPGWSEGDAPVVIRWFIEEGYSKEALIKEADLYTADEKLLMKTFEGDRDKFPEELYSWLYG